MSTGTHPRIKAMSPQLLVKDIGRAIKFYTEQLGFDLEFRYEDFYAGITRNGCSIHLKCGEPSKEERENKREHNDLDIVFSVEGVEELYKDFSGRQIEIIQPLCERPYGKEFYIVDLEGYVLAFLEGV